MSFEQQPAVHAPEFQNLFLRALPRDEVERLRPSLQRVELQTDQVVCEEGKPLEAAYFVQSGMLSILARSGDGRRVEVGVVGREGLIGLPLVLGGSVSATSAVVQVAATAIRIDAGQFRGALQTNLPLKRMLLRYVEAFHAQVTQTAVCNRRHRAGQRLCRWLLMTHDRSGADTFPLPELFLSWMLVVGPIESDSAIRDLRTAGAIEHEDGAVRILDRSIIERLACACYRTVEQRFAATLGVGFSYLPSTI